MARLGVARGVVVAQDGPGRRAGRAPRGRARSPRSRAAATRRDEPPRGPANARSASRVMTGVRSVYGYARWRSKAIASGRGSRSAPSARSGTASRGWTMPPRVTRTATSRIRGRRSYQPAPASRGSGASTRASRLGAHERAVQGLSFGSVELRLHHHRAVVDRHQRRPVGRAVGIGDPRAPRQERGRGFRNAHAGLGRAPRVGPGEPRRGGSAGERTIEGAPGGVAQRHEEGRHGGFGARGARERELGALGRARPHRPERAVEGGDVGEPRGDDAAVEVEVAGGRPLGRSLEPRRRRAPRQGSACTAPSRKARRGTGSPSRATGSG